MSTSQPNARALPPPGTFGPLVPVARLGSGGFGTVFRVKHAQTGAEYALKVLRPENVDEDLLARFAREMQVLAAFRDPGIVRIHGSGRTADGSPWFSMDLLEGAPLSELIARAGKLPPREAAGLVAKVARTMARAHAKGVVHRDLKPENIFVDAASGDPRLVDFGLAWDDAGAKDRLTRTGIFVGTPAYMAPEQAEGKPATGATDIWALGVVWFKATTGELPFVANGSLGTIQAILTREPRLPSRVNPDLPPAVDEVFLHCCERDPKRRYRSGVELAADLEAFVRGEPVSAKGRIAARAQAERRRRLGRVALVAAIVLIVLGVPGAIAYTQIEAARRAAAAKEAAEAKRRHASRALAAFAVGECELDELAKRAPDVLALPSEGLDERLLAERAALRPLAELVLLPPADGSKGLTDRNATDARSLVVGVALALAANDPIVAANRLDALDRQPPSELEPLARREATLRARVRSALALDTGTPEERAKRVLALLARGVAPRDVPQAMQTDVIVWRRELYDQSGALLNAVAQSEARSPDEARDIARRMDLADEVLEKLGIPRQETADAHVVRDWLRDPGSLDLAMKADPRIRHTLIAHLADERGDAATALRENEETVKVSLTANERDTIFAHAWKEVFVLTCEEGRVDDALATTRQVPPDSREVDILLARAWAWLFVPGDTAFALRQLDDIEAHANDPNAPSELKRFLGETYFVRGMLELARLRPPSREDALHDLEQSLVHEATPARLRVRAALAVMALEPRLRSWAERALAGDRSPPPSPPGR